jgi:hypothetical protein
MTIEGEGEPIGCASCFDGTALEVSHRVASLEHLQSLVDESHLIVRILACGTCGQKFVRVFSESIAWSGGDDAQAWLTIPINTDEQHYLAGLPADDVETAIVKLEPKRRCLDVYHPTDGPPQIEWSMGPSMVMRHD